MDDSGNVFNQSPASGDRAAKMRALSIIIFRIFTQLLVDYGGYNSVTWM